VLGQSRGWKISFAMTHVLESTELGLRGAA
jgi:hypothetical protein